MWTVREEIQTEEPDPTAEYPSINHEETKSVQSHSQKIKWFKEGNMSATPWTGTTYIQKQN